MATFACFVCILSGEWSINKWLPEEVCATHTRNQIEIYNSGNGIDVISYLLVDIYSPLFQKKIV